MYKVTWKKSALKDLDKIDYQMVEKIFAKVENYLTKDPINLGEPLIYDYKGLYRYRFSEYRIIYQINQSELLITIVKVGNRRDVY